MASKTGLETIVVEDTRWTFGRKNYPNKSQQGGDISLIAHTISIVA